MYASRHGNIPATVLLQQGDPRTNKQLGIAGTLIALEPREFARAHEETHVKGKTHAYGAQRPGYAASVVAIIEHLIKNKDKIISSRPLTERSMRNASLLGYDRGIALVRERRFGCRAAQTVRPEWQDDPRSMASITIARDALAQAHTANLASDASGRRSQNQAQPLHPHQGAPATGGPQQGPSSKRRKRAVVTDEIKELRVEDCMAFLRATRQLLPEDSLPKLVNRRSVELAWQDVADQVLALENAGVPATSYSLVTLAPAVQPTAVSQADGMAVDATAPGQAMAVQALLPLSSMPGA